MRDRKPLSERLKTSLAIVANENIGLNGFKVVNKVGNSKIKMKTEFQDIEFAQHDAKFKNRNDKKTLVLDLDETLIHAE